MSKTQKILEYIQTHDGITSVEAYEKFRATRLSAIIFNLKKRGYKIATYDMTSTGEDGHPARYAKYVYRGVE